MTIRAKFHCHAVAEATDDQGKLTGASVNLRAVMDGSPENKRFWSATPSGDVTMYITNPDAVVQFTPGKDYYLDFTPCDADEANASDQLGLGDVVEGDGTGKALPAVDDLLSDGERIDKASDDAFPGGPAPAAAAAESALGLATVADGKSDPAPQGDGSAPLAAVAAVKDPAIPEGTTATALTAQEPAQDTDEEKAAKDAAAAAVKAVSEDPAPDASKAG